MSGKKGWAGLAELKAVGAGEDLCRDLGEHPGHVQENKEVQWV